MAKLSGNLRIAAVPASESSRFYFEVSFLPYAGKLNTRPVRVPSHDELVNLLLELKLPEDEATLWAGKARSQGLVLIASVERTDLLLKENGLLA
jgi:hypothetical protein